MLWLGQAQVQENKSYCTLPSGIYRSFITMLVFQLQRKTLDVKCCFQRDLHLFGWEYNTNYEILSFLGITLALLLISFKGYSALQWRSNYLALWKYNETSSLGYIKKYFVTIFLNQSENFLFTFIGNLVEKSLFEIFQLIINSTGRNKKIPFKKYFKGIIFSFFK